MEMFTGNTTLYVYYIKLFVVLVAQLITFKSFLYFHNHIDWMRQRDTLNSKG